LGRADGLAFRWLVAAGVLLVLGLIGYFYYAGFQNASGNSLAFVIPAAIVGIVGVWLLRRPPTGWRRAFLVLAALYLAWTLAAIAVGIGVLFVPSAVCAVISALLANGV
jgi:hypothetical protein